MSNNKQQTAVEWLYNELLNAEPNVLEWNKLLERAKEMEKEQIIKAHGIKFDYSYSQIDPKEITGEQYYNEIYGGNK
jgi:hypothetical protein